MTGKYDPSQCRILVTGDELVELKRHAHEIPECPGLDRRNSLHYNGLCALVSDKAPVAPGLLTKATSASPAIGVLTQRRFLRQQVACVAESELVSS